LGFLPGYGNQPGSATTVSRDLAFAANVLLRWKVVQGEEEAFMAHLLHTSIDPRFRPWLNRLPLCAPN